MSKLKGLTSLTFPPVVEWANVRFLLIVLLILGHHAAQDYYVAVFVQSDIHTPGKVLKLKK
jgi:hypothetical protein